MPHISPLRCGFLRRHDPSSQPCTPIRHFLDILFLLLDAGDVADGAAGGAGGEGGVGLEGLRDSVAHERNAGILPHSLHSGSE